MGKQKIAWIEYQCRHRFPYSISIKMGPDRSQGTKGEDSVQSNRGNQGNQVISNIVLEQAAAAVQGNAENELVNML